MSTGKILEMLREKQGYVSGEEMSLHLKISRQALWKQIQELRDSGYEIVAVPHLGYQLASAPDRLFAQEIQHGLKTKSVGQKIIYFESIPSTMDIAWRQGIDGAPDGALVVSEAQTKGKGRLGRDWFSPKHKGIYFSLILRPKISPAEAPLLTILTAVSICEAIKQNSGLVAQIKWPNDILLQQKKAGGILTDLNAEMDVVHFAVIGVGLNVNNEKKSLPLGATSLRQEAEESINRVQLLQQILQVTEKNYLIFQKHGAREILEKWRDYNVTLGRRVKVLRQKETLEGEAVDIDSDGRLLVRKDSGVVEKISAGDILHCR